MPALSGVVEAISIKALNEPDRFGNLHRCSIKLGEDWVSWGTTKKPEISYKEGDDYKTLQKGMEVEFMYKQNGDFKNISKTSLAVISTEGAQAAAPSAPAQQAAPAYKKPYVSSNVNPAEVGQCLNLAADVLGLDAEALLDTTQVTAAIKWYKEVRELFTELYPSVEVSKPVVKEKPVKAAKKAEEQPPMDLSDDDEI
tara:strand:- start:699 stop:1292 length:594 start_codon:yes stop_codon:yes gene_type:complete